MTYKTQLKGIMTYMNSSDYSMTYDDATLTENLQVNIKLIYLYVKVAK